MNMFQFYSYRYFVIIFSFFLFCDSFGQTFVLGDADNTDSLQIHEPEQNSNQLIYSKKKDLGKPVVYTTILFIVDLTFLIVTGMADDCPGFENFKNGFKYGPAPDNDSWIHNYFLHPLMGSETYLRARESNLGWFGSFLFSTTASFAWEFIFESWTERPSTQDLLITSPTGSVLGEIRYQLKKKMKKKNHWLVDPIYSLILSLKRDNDMAVGLSFRF